MRFFSAVLFVVLFVSLSGCYVHVIYPDQARLSYSSTQFGRDADYFGFREVDTNDGPVQILFTASDVTDKGDIYNDGRGYWISLIAVNRNRMVFHRQRYEQLNIQPSIPIHYSARQVFIETGDGQRIYPDGVFYLGNQANSEIPGDEFLQSPANLNADEIHSRNIGASLGLYRQVFLRFPVKPPSVDEGLRWKVHFGVINVNGQDVELGIAGYRYLRGVDTYVRQHMLP